MRNKVTIKATFIAVCTMLSASVYAIADTPKQVDIPAGELSVALLKLSKQYGADLVYRPEQVHGLRTRGAHGSLTTEQAAMQLLQGTPLELRTDPSGAMLITPPTEGSAQGTAPAGASNSAREASDDSKGAGKKSSQDFRVAQVDQGKTTSDVPVDEPGEKAKKHKTEGLEEIVVTGSRLTRTSSEGPQELHTYSSEQIDQSGQTTLADFFSTLPEVSIGATETSQFGNSTTVRLHGLPAGTTLVLLNGRRVQVTGSTSGNGDFFDLNMIPVSAVERVEVLPEGSSAVYGADAIAGVVNIILKKNFDGLEASTKYGWASGTNEEDSSLAWGKQWSRGSLSIVANFQTRGELSSNDRVLAPGKDFRSFGGQDERSSTCNPGNVFSLNGQNLPGLAAPFAAVPSGFTGKPSIGEFTQSAGTLNQCTPDAALIPETRRGGILLSGNVNVTPSVELFTEQMFSRTDQMRDLGNAGLFGGVGFSQGVIPASNPFNPFGTPVGFSESFPTLPDSAQRFDTTFVRSLVGARGDFLRSWHWELAGLESMDRTLFSQYSVANAAAIQTALNSPDSTKTLDPFISGPAASQGVLGPLFNAYGANFSGRTTAINAFVRGPLVELPAGAVQVVLGGEYDRDAVSIQSNNDPHIGSGNFHRSNHAFFGEARVPLIGSSPETSDTLAATVAGRYDTYGGFGSKATPQYGIEWRPWHALLVRGTYSGAFKAPSLIDLFRPQTTNQTTVNDPLNGNRTETIEQTVGGNPNLRPESGLSRTYGFVYTSEELPGLRMSITHWAVDESNSIQNLSIQTIIENPTLFPDDVIRAPSINGQPGPITAVIHPFLNFGEIHVAGFDFETDYHIRTRYGDFAPSVAVTQTYRYLAALMPGAPPTDRTSRANDDGNFAPRWKGTVALGWKRGAWSANMDGRYVGSYQDYDSTRKVGNFWLSDVNLRWALGETLKMHSRLTSGLYIEFGGVNLFNILPQYSNYEGGFGGFDPTQSDMRGRFLYAQIGGKW